ncbi:MAG: hypothetical protein ABIZ49_08640, partial [Opitutaceae bacterium]
MLRSFVRLVLSTLFAICFVDSSWAQVEGALVTRRGAVIRGTVEGTLIALNEAAEVTVERGAEVKGDLVLPADKTGAKVD